MAPLVGALAGLVVGLAIQGLFQSAVYPAWRRAHEAAKMTQSHGLDPSRAELALKLVCFLLLPLAGLLAARAFWE